MTRITFIALLLLILASCKSLNNVSDKPVISVSILPQQYFIERIAGELVEVNVMIPPGASPATYEPSVSQLSRIDKSPVYMRIGFVGFELSWMEKINAVNPSMKVVDLSLGIEPIIDKEDNHHHLPGHARGGIDPHIWMSALNAKIIAKNIYDELVLLMPEEKDKLYTRFNELLHELDALHQTISKLLSGKVQRGFMIYHPALSYFARDYELEQHPLEIGGKTPSPARMKWMSDLGQEKNISTIFLQKQFEKKNAEVLAREIGAQVVQINPLDQDWPAQMIFIAKQLNTSL